MKNVWSKLSIPNHIVKFNNKGYYVIINPENANTVKLSNDEFEIFDFLYAQKGLNELNLNHPNFSNGEVNAIFMKLIRTNIFCLKKPSFDEDKYKTHVVHSDAYIGLTDACNFRCIYCYAECGPEAINEQIKILLSYEDYCKIIDEVVNVGYKKIFFTGGEPLLNPHIFKLARYVKGKGLFCGIVSNGSLIAENNIKKFHVFDIVKISLDSNIEEINDITRGKGTYLKIITALNLLKANEINIAINTVLTNHNKDVIKDLIEFVHNEYKPIEHTIANHIPVGRGACNSCEIKSEDLEKYMKDVVDSKYRLTVNHIDSVVPDKHFKNYRKTHCGMAAGEIFVNCEGKVYPCRMTYKDDYYLGNIFDIGLRKAIAKFDIYSDRFCIDNLEKCKDCDIKYLCGGGCRMLHYGYSGAIEKTSTEVCKILRSHLENIILIENNMY